MDSLMRIVAGLAVGAAVLALPLRMWAADLPRPLGLGWDMSYGELVTVLTNRGAVLAGGGAVQRWVIGPGDFAGHATVGIVIELHERRLATVIVAFRPDEYFPPGATGWRELGQWRRIVDEAKARLGTPAEERAEGIPDPRRESLFGAYRSGRLLLFAVWRDGPIETRLGLGPSAATTGGMLPVEMIFRHRVRAPAAERLTTAPARDY